MKSAIEKIFRKCHSATWQVFQKCHVLLSLPWIAQSDFITSFQKEHNWNRSSWFEKGSRSSETWSCCLYAGSCKWSWLLLERVLREDMIREPKIQLQFRTDSYKPGNIFWSHCWLSSKLTDLLCNSSQGSQWGSGHHQEKYWECHISSRTWWS